MPRAKFDQCLADKGALDKLIELRKQATDTYKLTGTPGFIINGVVQEAVYDWKGLEPKLQAALQ
jgi:protein-disulfide isomerase